RAPARVAADDRAARRARRAAPYLVGRARRPRGLTTAARTVVSTPIGAPNRTAIAAAFAARVQDVGPAARVGGRCEAGCSGGRRAPARDRPLGYVPAQHGLGLRARGAPDRSSGRQADV